MLLLMDIWVFVTFEVLSEYCSFDFFSKNSIQVVVIMSLFGVWEGFHFIIFIIHIKFSDYLHMYSYLELHFVMEFDIFVHIQLNSHIFHN